LSPRESQVVELMGKGFSRAEISDRLGVSRKCVSVFIEARALPSKQPMPQYQDRGRTLS
jgi:orotate phosphoribosyltransferase-like protein